MYTAPAVHQLVGGQTTITKTSPSMVPHASIFTEPFPAGLLPPALVSVTTTAVAVAAGATSAATGLPFPEEADDKQRCLQEKTMLFCTPALTIGERRRKWTTRREASDMGSDMAVCLGFGEYAIWTAVCAGERVVRRTGAPLTVWVGR